MTTHRQGAKIEPEIPVHESISISTSGKTCQSPSSSEATASSDWNAYPDPTSYFLPTSRFYGFDIVIIVDEFGNPGLDPRPSETKFGYAVSVTTRPDEFVRITEKWRRYNRAEVKARNVPLNQRTDVSSSIFEIGTLTYAFVVDKRNPPAEWMWKNRGKAMMHVLESSVDAVLPKVGDALVIVDHHSSYRGHVAPMVRSRSNPYRKTVGIECDSNHGMFSDALQTHDFVANAARAAVELGDYSRADILRMKIRETGEWAWRMGCGLRGLAGIPAPDPSSGLDHLGPPGVGRYSSARPFLRT